MQRILQPFLPAVLSAVTIAQIQPGATAWVSTQEHCGATHTEDGNVGVGGGYWILPGDVPTRTLPALHRS